MVRAHPGTLMVNHERCRFCNLSSEEIIKENKYARLFLSNPRKVKGHFLVIPKRHVEKPWKLTKEEINSVFQLIFYIQKLLSEKFEGGCDIKQHYRPFVKENNIKVDHVHFHVYPRQFKDELYQKVEKFETDLFIPLSKKEQQKIFSTIINGKK